MLQSAFGCDCRPPAAAFDLPQTKGRQPCICSLHRHYQRPQRIQGWPAASIDAVVRVRCFVINVDEQWPAGDWRAGKQIDIGNRGCAGEKIGSALFLTTTEGKKIWVFVGFGRGSGRANASVLMALS